MNGLKNKRSTKKGKSLVKIYFQPAFLICVIVLAMAAGGMSFAIKKFDIYFTKEYLPLKKPLDQLNESKLGNYEVISKAEIEYDEVIEALGTDEYLQWILEDKEADKGSPTRFCSLFVTYYGVPDKVPHIPDECYMGSGFQRKEVDDLVYQDGKFKVPGRMVHFERKGKFGFTKDFYVCYFFHVNGKYSQNRLQTRKELGKNIFGKYSYFCKIEWKFYNKFPNLVYPEKEEVLIASRKLLKTIVPLLEKDHLPDWENLKKKKGS